MINQELLDYVKNQLTLGVTREKIKQTLLAQNWSGQDIEEAFGQVEGVRTGDLTPSPSATPQLLSAGVLLGNTWSFYKKRWKTLAGIVLATALISFFGGEIGAFLIEQSPLKENLVLSVLLTIAFAIFVIILSAWQITALWCAIRDSEEQIGIRESYRRSLKKIISLQWVLLLVSLITAGGFFLLLIPAIIFSIWFSLAPLVVICENVGGLNALLKSREYVRGKWGGVFWRGFFIGLFSLIIALPLVGLGVLTDFLLAEVAINLVSDNLLSSLTITFLGTIRILIDLLSDLLIIPLVSIYSFLLYRNLKEIKGELLFQPSRKAKVVFPVIGLLGIVIPVIILVFVFFSLFPSLDSGIGPVNVSPVSDSRSRARDSSRQGDMQMIASAMELYYSDAGKYLTSEAMPSAIGSYMTEVYLDPKTKSPYGWVDNTNDDQKFCAYARLENKADCINQRYYFTSHRARNEVCDVLNWTLDCP